MSEQITTARFTNGVGKKEKKETEVLAKARRRYCQDRRKGI